MRQSTFLLLGLFLWAFAAVPAFAPPNDPPAATVPAETGPSIDDLKRDPARILTYIQGNTNPVAMHFRETLLQPDRLRAVIGDEAEPTVYRLFLVERIETYLSTGEYPNATAGASEYLLALFGVCRDTRTDSQVRLGAFKAFRDRIWKNLGDDVRSTALSSLRSYASHADRRPFALPALFFVENAANTARRVVALATETNVQLRRRAMEALAYNRYNADRHLDADVQAAVATLLRDSDDWVRRYAGRFLAEKENAPMSERNRLGSAALESIRAIVVDDTADAAIRATAIQTLGANFTRTFYSALPQDQNGPYYLAIRNALGDADRNVRAAALGAFRAIKPADADSQVALVRIAFGADPQLSSSAFAALGAFHGHEREGRLNSGATSGSTNEAPSVSLAGEAVKAEILAQLERIRVRPAQDRNGTRGERGAELLRRNPVRQGTNLAALVALYAAWPTVGDSNVRTRLTLLAAIRATGTEVNFGAAAGGPEALAAVASTVAGLDASDELGGIGYVQKLRPGEENLLQAMRAASGPTLLLLARQAADYSPGRLNTLMRVYGAEECLIHALRDRAAARILVRAFAAKKTLLKHVPQAFQVMLEIAATPEPADIPTADRLDENMGRILHEHAITAGRHVVVSNAELPMLRALRVLALREGPAKAGALAMWAKAAKQRQCGASVATILEEENPTPAGGAEPAPEPRRRRRTAPPAGTNP